MKYTDLEDTTNFFRNMRKTPWLKLFPHWWSEKDPLLKAIGDEIESFKASTIFAILNAGIKPPVLLWQTSLNHKVFNVNKDITELPSIINIQAPLYKTWGNITLTNNTEDDIDGIEITFDDKNGFAINNMIKQNDIIKINLYENKVQLNGHTIKPQKIGKGMPYFITTNNNNEYVEGTPLHNEILKIKVNTDTNLEDTTITETHNVTNNIEKWNVLNNGYVYNPQGADPWLAIDTDSSIEYELDFSNITEVSFWYKANKPGHLKCYADNRLIFSKEVDTTFTNYIIDTRNITYIENHIDIVTGEEHSHEYTTHLDGKGMLKFINDGEDGSIYINDIKYVTESKYKLKCDMNIDINLENAVFYNEQNIEVTGLELIPIESIELYANYDFDYNKPQNGWQKVYQKKYDKNTNVIYDMITTHFFTKQFYVDVWFKTLQYPYKVGFPCYKDAETNSMYHVNNRLDVWGEELGLERRLYKEEIPEQEYPNTFPIYYPFDIEQDYWYYKRLVNEYTWNDLAINDVDIKDTEGNNIMTLYSINPFCEDFVVHTQSKYPIDKEYVDYNEYYPSLITQRAINNSIHQSEYSNIGNLLGHNNFYASITLNNDSDNNDIIYKKETTRDARQTKTLTHYNRDYIRSEGHKSKELITFFNLSNLPEDINIDDIKVIVEAESTDNKTNKFSTEETGLRIPSFTQGEEFFIPLVADKSYQLNKQFITYSIAQDVNPTSTYKFLQNTITDNIPDKQVRQTVNIGAFEAKKGDYAYIPFTLQEVKNYFLDLKYEYKNDKYVLTATHTTDNIPISQSKIKLIDMQTGQPFKYNNQTEFLTNNQGQYQWTVPMGVYQAVITDTTLGYTLKSDTVDLFKVINNTSIVYNHSDDSETTAVINVDDIKRISVYYNEKHFYTGTIVQKNGQQCIKVRVPRATSATKMQIDVECEEHQPFTTKIDIATISKTIDTDENSDEPLIEQYIKGPLMENESQSITIDDTWHTQNLRNLLQKQGVFFHNIFQNNDEQSTTTINLYNIKLEVHYSQKKTNFTLDTYINTLKVDSPSIGEHIVTIKNTGEKPLKTSIDIVSPPNVALSKNYIDVDLNIGESATETIQITPQYPIVDGSYDIVTFCEDTVKRNSIIIFSDGLIQTNVDVKPHFGKYNEQITLSAEVHSIDGAVMNSGQHRVQFYINGYIVPQTAAVYNNKATLTIQPGDYFFTDTGVLTLEARYLGTTKYKTSKGLNTIYISKNSTRITITSANKAVYGKSYQAKAVVEYFDGEQYSPVTDGHVTFYIKKTNFDGTTEEEILGVSNNNEGGVFIASLTSVQNPAHEYTLKARYEGSNKYASNETTIDFDIIGGAIKVLVFEEIIKPYDSLRLKARVVDANNKVMPDGYVTFYIRQNNQLVNIEGVENPIKNVPVRDGMAITDDFVIGIDNINDDADVIYNVYCSYHGIENATQSDGAGNGNIIIRKGTVTIDCSSLYVMSEREPLGFYMTIKDATTNQPLTSNDGEIYITLPKQKNFVNSEEQTLSIKAEIDDKGGVRALYDPIELSSREWQELIQWSFLTANDDSLNQINNYNPDNLYAIFNGAYTYAEKDKSLMNFELNNDNLYIKSQHDTTVSDEQIKEYAYIGKDGYLYARTDNDNEHKREIGVQDIKIEFSNSQRYKKNTIYLEKALNIQQQVFDLDIHSYDITYTNTDPINCYVTKYDYDEVNKHIEDGQVQFIFDDILIDTINVTDGKATFDNEKLTYISAGKHLLEVNYLTNGEKSTRSYSYFTLTPSTPTIQIVSDSGMVRSRNTQFIVNISTESTTVPLDGMVSLYLDGEKIDDKYINRNAEDGYITYDKDKDPYDDNDTTTPSSTNVSLTNNNASTITTLFDVIMPDDIDTNSTHKLVAIYEGNEYYTKAESAPYSLQETPSAITITSEDIDMSQIVKVGVNEECSIDFIVTDFYEDIINEGTVSLIAGDTVVSSGQVVENIATIKWTPTELGQRTFTLKYDNGGVHYEQKSNVNYIITFEGISPSSYITIDDKNNCTLKQSLMCLQNNGTIRLNKDIELKNTLNINKNCTIEGGNDCKLTMNGASIINNAQVHIDNIHIISEQNTQITNNNYLVINHSIIDKHITLQNNKKLIAQRNFIYGKCIGQSDLDNNWWGTNQAPYNVNNHIIITVKPNNTPAVISEEITLTGRMIGANGREYDLPEANFMFGADTGYFSIDTGTTVNNQITTKYLDAEKEGQIYFIVDNETAVCYVYEYERKTEVILDDFSEIPLHYQVPIKAKVQSCADTFYEFNEGKVSKSSQTINNGYISFYINDEQVGYSPVQDGEAQTVVFFNQYYQNTEYTLKAVYTPDDYYFSSEDTTFFTISSATNMCFVSYDGDDGNSGTFDSPVATITKALSLNKSNIYLLDDRCYTFNNNINKTVTIKSFKNNTVFGSLSGTNSDNIFIIQPGVTLSLENIDFVNNDITVFNNKGTLDVKQSLLYKNKRIFNNTGNNITITYSAIVDNTVIANTPEASWFIYCWFGENNPNISNINNHVQMSYSKSKDKIYIGTLAHITGELKTYKNNNVIYELNHPLPLRMAKFNTTYGSMKPTIDYTYDNKSTSLLNTQEENNTHQWIIDISENKNYIGHDVLLKCFVHTPQNDPVPDNTKVTFNIKGNGMNITDIGSTTGGYASITLNPLSKGNYTLTCTSENDILYTATRNFSVTKPEIVVKNFNISNGDNLYYSNILLELEDNFGNTVNNERINFNIDGQYVTNKITQEGVINTNIEYNKIPEGQHVLTFYNTKDSPYSNFSVDKPFYTKSKDVNIYFDYDFLEANVHNVVNIEILDDENNNVNDGYIDVDFDGTRILSQATVVNGLVTIKDLFIREKGQHSIVIYYSGVEKYYNQSIFVNSNLNVGVYNVIFGIQDSEYVQGSIGKPLIFSTSVTDVGKQPINMGYVNVYINNIQINDSPIYVNNGNIHINEELPTNITSGTYNLQLEYIDSTETYAHTEYNTFLQIGRIQTSIQMDTIYAPPNQRTAVRYQILTPYGKATTGTLIAKYNNIIIGRHTVNENIINQIYIDIPFLPAIEEGYTINFEYEDENIYQSSITSTKLIIEKTQVNIIPSHTSYYPQKKFYFTATIKDSEGDYIDIGKASLYVNNVQEIEPQDVQNGQIQIPLTFNQSTVYDMKIVYEENDYYDCTEYNFKFSVGSIDIDDITFSDNISQINLNSVIDTQLVFSTQDNYNVKDGIIDIFIDGNILHTYHIVESNKYITLNMNNIKKGEHKLTLKYHDSVLFNDFVKEDIPITIAPKTLQLQINNGQPIEPEHNTEIQIKTDLYTDIQNQVFAYVNSIINYYIGIPNPQFDENGIEIDPYYDWRYIGVEKVNNENTNSFTYTIPDNLLEYAATVNASHYKIKAECIGDDEYDEATTCEKLIIHQKPCSITFTNYTNKIEAQYRDTITIDFDITSIGRSIVNFYIDNVPIGTTTAENGHGSFSYKLNDKYNVTAGNKYYKIKASYDGSSVDTPASKEIQMQVNQLEPIIDTSSRDIYYGGDLKLDNQITDSDGTIINDGQLIYTIQLDEESIFTKAFTVNLPSTVQIPSTTKSQLNMNVTYTTDNPNYKIFNDKNIQLHLIKNDVVIKDIEFPKYMCRDEEGAVELELESYTTRLPIDLKYGQQQVSDNKITIPITIPPTENSSFTFSIALSGSQFFTNLNKDIEINILDSNTITVDTDATENGTTTKTIAKALKFVKEHGTIIIKKAPAKENIIIEKSVNIRPESTTATLTKCSITNKANDVNIEGIKFKDNTNVPISNNGELEIKNCQFQNITADSVIQNSNNIYITESKFNNNNVRNGTVYISRMNKSTNISKCKFTQNTASLNASCICSVQGNNVNIEDNLFTYNKHSSNIWSCIYIIGDAHISSNSFYKNQHASEIFMYKGYLTADNNVFSGVIKSINCNEGAIDADFNYWGYNNIDDIVAHNTLGVRDTEDPNSTNIINNWLISRRIDEDVEQEINGTITANHIVKAVIDQYKNRFETETVQIEPIKKDYLIMVGETPSKLNKEDDIVPNYKFTSITVGMQELPYGGA